MCFLFLLDKWRRQLLRDPLSLFLTLGISPLILFLFRVLLPIEVSESGLSSFDIFVPAFIVFSIIMTLFSSSILLSREMEAGVYLRYHLSGVSRFSYWFSYGMVEFVLGLFSFSILFFVAIASGFSPQGGIYMLLYPVFVGLAITVLLGILTTIPCKNVQQSFLLSSFVMFILLIFSGAFFPLTEGSILSYIPTYLIYKIINDGYFYGKDIDLRTVVTLAMFPPLLFIALTLLFSFKRKVL